MGADMILAYMPKFKMTDERKKQGIAAIANATEEQLKNSQEFAAADSKEQFIERLNLAFEEVEHLYGRRDVAEIQPPGCPYPLLISGGPSWGDEPTEACRTISLVTDFDPLYDLFVQWAGEDRPQSGFVRVSAPFSYIVPANREDMINAAKEAVLDDICSAIKHGFNFDVQPEQNATDANVPDFIIEQCKQDE